MKIKKMWIPKNLIALQRQQSKINECEWISMGINWNQRTSMKIHEIAHNAMDSFTYSLKAPGPTLTSVYGSNPAVVASARNFLKTYKTFFFATVRHEPRTVSSIVPWRLRSLIFFVGTSARQLSHQIHPRHQNDQTLQPMTRELGTKPPTQYGNNSIPAGQTLQPMTQELGTKPPTQDGNNFIPGKIRGQSLTITERFSSWWMRNL